LRMGFWIFAIGALSRGMRAQRMAEGSPRGGYDHRASPIREIRANPWPFSFVIPEIRSIEAFYALHQLR
jgi:hypothetical protein